MICTAAVWYVAAVEIRDNNSDMEDTLKALTIGVMVRWTVSMAYELAPDISSSYESTRRLFDIIDHEPSIYRPRQDFELPITGDVTFANVSFRYPNR